MLKLALAVAAIAVLGLIAAALTAKAKRGGSEPIRAKKLLTDREQPMFFRLQQAFPEHVVLCQVAFAALLTARHQATRATFNRKFADFVLASKAFEVVAVIELDDASHRGRAGEDGRRDAMLKEAGYRVLRFPRVPDVNELRRALSEEPRGNV